MRNMNLLQVSVWQFHKSEVKEPRMSPKEGGLE